MNASRFFRLFALFAVAVILGGCAHVISADLREKAQSAVPFANVQKNPDLYKGQMVVWGGKIIETVNQDAGTEIKVLQMPLDAYEMPVHEELSEGRFIAKLSGYVDNQIYRAGRWVTVGGELTGQEAQPLGESTYTYPVVTVKEIHLWREPYYGYPPPYPYWGGYPYPYYDPYFWPYHPFPYWYGPW